MAKDWIDELLGGIESGSEAASPYLQDAEGIVDPFSQAGSIGVDDLFQRLTGKPLGVSGMQPVKAGVSDGEALKAHVKMQEAQAQQTQADAALKSAQESEIMKRLEMLTNASKSGTRSFVAKGNDSAETSSAGSDAHSLYDPSTDQVDQYAPTSGSFSRSNKSIGEQSKINELISQGIPQQYAEGLLSPDPNVRALILEKIKGELPVSQHEILGELSKSHDPMMTIAAFMKFLSGLSSAKK